MKKCKGNSRRLGCNERPKRLGLTVTEMIPGIPEGKIHALYIMGEDPVTSDPDSSHIRHCLEQLDFLVLQDIFPTETSAFADVLLPGVSFAEKNGTFTNTERRVQMVRQAIPPLGDAKSGLADHDGDRDNGFWKLYRSSRQSRCGRALGKVEVHILPPTS